MRLVFAVAALLLLAIPAGAQTPEQAFTRSRFSDPGFGPEHNGTSCGFCHQGVLRGVFTLGAHGPSYRSTLFTRPRAGGPTSIIYRLTTAPGYPLQPTEDYLLSARMPTSLLGTGLVEQVTDQALLANADPFDLDGDGISGIAQIKDGRVARFGTQACHATLDDAVTAALVNEFSIEPEHHDQEDVALLLEFVRGLAPAEPSIALGSDPQVDHGAQVFEAIGCAGCHVMALPLPGGGTIHPYSDYLMHDMGAGLNDRVGLCASGGREWKTAPLWGRRAPYLLHDGRITTAQFIQVIRYHGGEATAAANAYSTLSTSDQAALRAFVESR